MLQGVFQYLNISMTYWKNGSGHLPKFALTYIKEAYH